MVLVSKLKLDTFHLINDFVNNPNGSRNHLHTKFTWNNINLRVLLGDEYDKYDNFKLVLYQVCSQGTNNDFGYDKNDKRVQLAISGLEWVNCSYGPKNQNLSEAFISEYLFYDTGSTQYPKIHNYKEDLNSLIFKKRANVDITIEYYNFNDDTIDSTVPNTLTYPEMNFRFNIIGIN